MRRCENRQQLTVLQRLGITLDIIRNQEGGVGITDDDAIFKYYYKNVSRCVSCKASFLSAIKKYYCVNCTNNQQNIIKKYENGKQI
jgi:reverse gyrase